MSKTLEFTYKDVDYVLEFTRKSVQQMERNGFVAAEVETRPMTTLPQLFAGAFLAHHRFVKKEVIEEIYSKLTNKGELVGKLAEMYSEPINALLDDPEEKSGNVDWTASF